MRLCRLVFVLGASVVFSALAVSAASAAPTSNDQFGQIMGFAATIDKTASPQMTCVYQGPADSGGQFMILTDMAFRSSHSTSANGQYSDL
jgi:hypothetical protein